MTRASVLVRISVDATASDSVERQEAELRLLADRLGAEVVAVHADRGVSGAAKRRPALDAWLADAEAGRADLLLAWDWSRISREGLRAVGRVIDVLDSTGARLVTLRDNLDSSSPAFGIVTAVMAETAKAEREAIRARVSSRQAADRAKGRWVKPAPFGYTVDDGRLVPDECAPVLRGIVERYLDGDSIRAITAWLNTSGVKPPRAATWGVSSVRHILTSPATAGMLPHADDVVRGDDGTPIIVSDSPIITLAEHRAIIDRVSLNPQKAGRKPTDGVRHPLSGLVRCECGAPMVYQSRKDRRTPRFACRTNTSAHPSGNPSVPAPDLLNSTLARVHARLAACEANDEWLGRVAIRLGYAQAPAASAAIEAARAEVAEVNALLADAETARFSGAGFRGDDGKRRYDGLVKALSERLDSAQRVAAQDAPVVDVGALLDPQMWQGADDDTLRGLLVASVDRVVVTDRQVESIDWRE